MLAEIFMVRLEAAVRPVQEKLPSSVSPFVPFSPSRHVDGDPDALMLEPIGRECIVAVRPLRSLIVLIG